MKNIGIIGGNGGMGRLFVSVFEEAGLEVLVSGRTGSPSNTDIALCCDAVMVSVPIRSTAAVIREVAPLMKEDQVLCDLTSVKKIPVEEMLKSEASVIGFHPMFGPSVSGIRGQNIIATPARCPDRVFSEFSSIFSAQGARVTVMTPAEHDRVMAVVQGLVHFATLAVADAIRTSGTDIGKIEDVMSPVYRIEMGLIGRILGQSPELYGDILMMNPGVRDVLDRLTGSVERLKGIVEDSDEQGFVSFFSENRECFEDYIPAATRDTDAMVETLVDVE